MMYSANISSTFSADENGELAIDLAFQDTDGLDIEAYAKGDDIEKVLTDIVYQIEEAAAADEADNDEDDVDDYVARKIMELQDKIDALSEENTALKQKLAMKDAANKIEAGKVSDNTVKKSDSDSIVALLNPDVLKKIRDFNDFWSNSSDLFNGLTWV